MKLDLYRNVFSCCPPWKVVRENAAEQMTAKLSHASDQYYRDSTAHRLKPWLHVKIKLFLKNFTEPLPSVDRPIFSFQAWFHHETK